MHFVSHFIKYKHGCLRTIDRTSETVGSEAEIKIYHRMCVDARVAITSVEFYRPAAKNGPQTAQ